MTQDNSVSDEQLIELIANSDLKAMEELFNRYYEKLCNFAFTILKDEDLSKDIASEIFFNVWNKRLSLLIASSVRAYLYVAVRNRSINLIQANKKLFDIDRSSEAKNLIQEDNFITDLEGEEEVEKILGQLSEKKKLVFRLKVIDGLKYKEIAEILSISVNTVQNHMVQAFKILSKNKA